MAYEPGLLQAALRSARKKKATARPRKALILAGLVETNLQHEKYQNVGSGDRDSVGFLQQRPSQGWGPAGESAETDSDQFLEAAMRLNARGFKGSAGQLAQAVQRSAFPDKYDQRSAEAEKLLRGALGSTGVPEVDDDASHTSNDRRLIGMTGDTSQEPSVFDVIRRYDVATDPELSPEERTMQQQLLQAATRYEAPKMSITSLGSDTKEPTAPSTDEVKSDGEFKITGPSPGRLKPGLVSFARKVASVYGKPLTGSDGTGHSYRTATGGVSQHTTGDATDIPASGKQLTLMGQAALIAAGMPEAEARTKTGGLFNVNGHQIIFHDRKRVSGSPHDDHLHISAPGRRKRR
jgi:hypothetical protein